MMNITSPATKLLAAIRRRKVRSFDVASQAIFVVGCGHSGTTLTASIIGRHNNVLGIGEETSAFLRLSREYSRGAARQWDTFCKQFGKTHFVEKTPKHVHVIHRILQAIPAARIVYTVRNPLDNVASIYARSSDLRFSTDRYISDNKAGIKNLPDDRILIVRFEDVTRTPIETFDKIFQHCNLRFSTDILERTDSTFGHWAAEDGNKARRASEVSRPIQVNENRWKGTLVDSQAEVVLYETEAVAAELGYPISSHFE